MAPKHPVSLDNKNPQKRDPNRKKQPNQHAAKKATPSKKVYIPGLIFMGTLQQYNLLIKLLKQSQWFLEPCFPEEMFFKNKYKPVLHVRPKMLPYVALLLFDLHDYSLINTDAGKAYMKVACQFIYCKGKKVNERYMSKCISNIHSGKINSTLIVLAVDKILNSLQKKENQTLTRISQTEKD